MFRINLGEPTIEFMKVIDELFDETYNITSRKCPVHDVIENENEFLIELQLAGILKEDIHINVEENVLTIDAERKKDEKRKYNRNESYFGKYKRSFILPDNVNIDNIDVTLENGILTINIPKKNNEKKKKIQIEIK